MVRCWYTDPDVADQRLPPMPVPLKLVDIEDVKAKTGLLYFKVNADDFANCEILQKIRKDHDYDYEDTVEVNPQAMSTYHETLKAWFTEHIHPDEEIRLILEGGGYFDVRDDQDKWIRIEASKGDMVVLPAGLYHRFTLDKSDHLKCNRYFSGVPCWTALNRPQEDHPARKQYVASRTAQA